MQKFKFLVVVFLFLLSVQVFSQNSPYTGGPGGSPSYGGSPSEMGNSGSSSGEKLIQIQGPLISQLKETFSATFQSTSLSDIFNLFAYQSGLNLIVSPRINDTMTAKFKDVSMKNAFESILASYNLYYIERGKIIKILTYDEYLNEVKRDFTETRVYDASIIDLKNLPTVLKPVLSPGIGRLTVDKQSSKIFVTDIKDNFTNVDRIIHELSELPKLVEIETRILKIDLGDSDELGVNWSALNLGNIVDLSFNTFTPTAVNKMANQIFGLSGSSVLSSGEQINALIAALAQTKKTTLISQPRVLAVNRGKASILIGNKVPYIQGKFTTTDNTGTTASQTEFVDVGIKLTVRPLVTPDGTVKLSIDAELSSSEFISIASDREAPNITTTSVQCDVIAKDSQTVIIGGLIKSEKVKKRDAVPILGDIPILGYFFSHTTDSVVRSELAILITPHIVNPETPLRVQKNSKAMQQAITNTKD